MPVRNRLGAALAIGWLIVVILAVSLLEGRPARSATDPAPTPTLLVLPAS